MWKRAVLEKNFCNSNQGIFAEFGTPLIQKIDKQADMMS